MKTIYGSKDIILRFIRNYLQIRNRTFFGPKFLAMQCFLPVFFLLKVLVLIYSEINKIKEQPHSPTQKKLGLICLLIYAEKIALKLHYTQLNSTNLSRKKPS